MRVSIAAMAGGAVALTAASMLGVASAEAPAPTAAPRTVSVEGVATNVPIAQGASAATANAVYRQGMEAAVADAHSKAEFLAGKVGGSIGAAQSVAEGGGGISCTGGEGSTYVEYTGEQPDFGSPNVSVGPLRGSAIAAPQASPGRAPALRRRHRRHTATGKAAAAGTCTLSTQVSVAYLLN